MYESLGPHPDTPMVLILTLHGPPHLRMRSLECKDVDHGLVKIISGFALAKEIKSKALASNAYQSLGIGKRNLKV